MIPCKRCGYCCKHEICGVGQIVFGSIEPPCPALIKEGDIYSCAFVKAEQEFSVEPLIAEALGIGKGCDTF